MEAIIILACPGPANRLDAVSWKSSLHGQRGRAWSRERKPGTRRSDVYGGGPSDRERSTVDSLFRRACRNSR